MYKEKKDEPLCLEAFKKKKCAKQTKDNSYFILQSFLTPDRTFNEMLPVQKTLKRALSYSPTRRAALRAD